MEEIQKLIDSVRVNRRSVFRTQLKIYDGVFCEVKKLNRRFSTGF